MIFYKGGYKYQLTETYAHSLPAEFRGLPLVIYGYLETVPQFNMIRVKAGYAWDGPSGPTIDTKNFMRGSLVHDALYQLMREGHLNKAKYRVLADKELYRICREDGMSFIRANVVYYGVRWGAAKAADVGTEKIPTSAP